MSTIEQEASIMATPDMPEAPPAPPVTSGPSFWERLLVDTGPGEISDYLNHPLNTSGQPWQARALRGLTGLIGNLKLAVADILIAGVEYLANARKNGPTA